MDVLLLPREESSPRGPAFGGSLLLSRDGADVFSGFIGWGEEGASDKRTNTFVTWYKGSCLDY